MSATDVQPDGLKALALKVLERNRQCNLSATAPQEQCNFPCNSAPPKVAFAQSDVSEAQVALEAGYGRVTCLRCFNLSLSGVCRVKSTPDTNYTPLKFVPVLLWRRCEYYRSK